MTITPPPLSESGFELIEVASISETSQSPDYSVIGKYVNTETYETWFRNGHPDIGDILVPTVGSIGQYSIMKEKRGSIAQNIVGLVVKKGIDSFFLYYLLNGDVVGLQIKSVLMGAVQPSLRVPHFLQFKILIPPLPEQQKIASILTSVDEVIEKTQSQINKLQDLKKGTMNELLTKGIGNTEFKDSPVGKIPVGWEVKRLGDVFTLKTGSTPSRSTPIYFEEKMVGVPWVKTLDLNDKGIYDTDEHITEIALQQTSCKLLPINTVLVAMYGGWKQIGRTGVLKISAATNQAIVGLLLSDKVMADYCNYFLVGKRETWKKVAASSRKDPNITKDDVFNFQISIPPLPEQQKIASILSSMDSHIEEKQRKLEQTQSLKKSLMQDLLTGKVRVTVH